MMIGVAQVIGMKPTLRSFFSIAPPLAKTSVAVFSGKNCDSAASAVEAPSDLQEGAAADILRENRAHHRRSNHVLVAFLFALARHALQLCSGVKLVRRLADMTAAGAAAAVQ